MNWFQRLLIYLFIPTFKTRMALVYKRGYLAGLTQAGKELMADNQEVTISKIKELIKNIVLENPSILEVYLNDLLK